jgi:hypothetical protein
MGSGKYEKKRCKTSYIKAAVVHIQAGQKKNINLQLLPQILQSFFALYRTAVAPFSYRSHLIGRPPRLIRYNSPISLTLLFLNLRLCSQKTANLMMCLLCKARQGACLFFFIPANRWFGKATLRRFLGYGMWQLSISHGMDDTCVTF